MEIEGELKTALKERKVQFEMFFTLPDFSDISLRDYQETMQRPFFSLDRKSTRLNSSHSDRSRMPSSA